VVAFPDVKGASTDGADETAVVANAAECLTAALIGSGRLSRFLARARRAGGGPLVCPRS